MSRNNPRGFVEHKRLGGSVSPITRWYRTKREATHALAIRAGDPVISVSGNTVVRLGAAATAAQVPVLGIVRAVYNKNKRPFTHNLPSSNLEIAASATGWCEINVDPNQTYLVNTDGTVTSTHIGQYFEATAAAAGTAAGRSGFSIEIGTGTNTAGATTPFQIVNIGANNLGGIVGGENNQDVEVVIVTPTMRNTNKAR